MHSWPNDRVQSAATGKTNHTAGTNRRSIATHCSVNFVAAGSSVESASMPAILHPAQRRASSGPRKRSKNTRK
jgi:hypothetical protein